MKSFVCVAALVLASPLVFGFAKAHAQSISAPASPPAVASRQPVSSKPSPAAKLGAMMSAARAQVGQPNQVEAVQANVRTESSDRSERVRLPEPQRRNGPVVAAIDLR